MKGKKDGSVVLLIVAHLIGCQEKYISPNIIVQKTFLPKGV
jgi:hypothetical protein